MNATPLLLESADLARVPRLPGDSVPAPARGYEDDRADLLKTLKRIKRTYALGYDVSNLVRNLINAASAVNALTSQGAHPCVDVERILKMLPRVPDGFEPCDCAIMPAFELDKLEV